MTEQIQIHIGAKDDASKVINQVVKQLESMGKNVGKVTRVMKFKQVETGVTSLSNALKIAGLSTRGWNKYLQENHLQLQSNGMVMDRLTGQVTRLGANVKQASMNAKRFKMEYLSLLFMGMALQRTFKSMSITTTKFFMEVTEGQTEAGKAVTRLSASFQFLKFTVGDAIGQLILAHPAILDVIDGISDFVEKNKEFSAGFVIVSLALGTFLALLSQVLLGLMAVKIIFGRFIDSGWAFAGGIAIVVGAAILLIMVIENARETFFKFIKFVGEGFINFGKMVSALFRGDMSDALIYGELALLNFELAWVNFVKTLMDVLAGVGEAIVGLILTPMYLMAESLDYILGKLLIQSDVAGTIANNILKVTEAIKNFPATVGYLGLDAVEGNIQGRIDEIQPSSGGTNVTIENLNVNTENAEDLMQQLLDLIEAQGGGIRP